MHVPKERGRTVSRAERIPRILAAPSTFAFEEPLYEKSTHRRKENPGGNSSRPPELRRKFGIASCRILNE